MSAKEEIEQERSEDDPISAAICAIKGGQKLKFNPAQDKLNIIAGEDVCKPKMEDELMPNQGNDSNQEGDLADLLLEEQLYDLNDQSMGDISLTDTKGNIRSMTDGEMRLIIEGRQSNRGTENMESMLYKGQCPKCHLQFKHENSLGNHRRSSGGNCFVCRHNHNHDYLVRKFDTEDHVLDFIGKC